MDRGDRMAEEQAFCLGWERWASELTACVAQGRPWPLPPDLPAPPALMRLAAAAVAVVKAVWGCDVENKRLLKEARRAGKGKQDEQMEPAAHYSRDIAYFQCYTASCVILWYV